MATGRKAARRGQVAKDPSRTLIVVHDPAGLANYGLVVFVRRTGAAVDGPLAWGRTGRHASNVHTVIIFLKPLADIAKATTVALILEAIPFANNLGSARPESHWSLDGREGCRRGSKWVGKCGDRGATSTSIDLRLLGLEEI